MVMQKKARAIFGIFVLSVLLFSSMLPVSSLVSGPFQEASPRASVSLTKGPWLQNMTSSTISISWETNVTGSSSVQYGLDTNYGGTAFGPGGLLVHIVNISGLAQNTTYHYRVSTDGVFSADHTFKTSVGTHQTVHFAAYGDTRTNWTAHRSVVAQMNNSTPEFAVHVGDLVNSGTSQADWDNYFLATDGFADHTAIFPAPGNHENLASASSIYFKYNPFLNGSRWYSFDQGSVHFVSLDTTASYAVGSAQYDWLVSDLAAANQTADWIFVYFHHPPYSSMNSDMTVRTVLVPVFEKYKVDVVLAGHVHNYEHAQVNGIHYIVTGGGGAPLSGVSSSSWTVYTENTFEFVNITVTEHTVYFEGIRPNGTKFDVFNISRNDTTAPLPVQLTAHDTGLGGSVDLNWSTYDEAGPGDIVFYNIYMDTVDFSNASYLAPVRTLLAGNYTTRLTDLTNGTKYYFAVTAVDDVSNEFLTVVTANATPTDITPPAAPSGLKVFDPLPHSLNLSWDPNPEPDLAGYIVWFNLSNTNTTDPFELLDNLTITPNKKMVELLMEDTGYCFAVQALDQAVPPNPSAHSAPACAKTTFIPIPPPLPNYPPFAIDRFPWVHFFEDMPSGEENRRYSLAHAFLDLENDTLTYAITYSDLDWNISLSGPDAPYLVFDFEHDWYGTGQVNITASDDQGSAWANLTVEVSPVNDPPTLWAPSEWVAFEDNSSSFEFEVLDIDSSVEGLYLETDIYKKVPGAVLGDNYFISMTKGAIQIIPDEMMIGEYDIQLTAVDQWLARSATVKVHLSIRNSNDGPTVMIIEPVNKKPFTELDVLVFQANGSDPDLIFGDRLIYEWSSNYSGVFAYGQSIQAQFPPGTYIIKVVVTDRYGLWAEDAVLVKVERSTPPVPPPPPVVPPDNDTDNSTGTMLILGMCIAVVVVIVIVILFVLYSASKPRPGQAQVPGTYPRYGYPPAYAQGHMPQGYPPASYQGPIPNIPTTETKTGKSEPRPSSKKAKLSLKESPQDGKTSIPKGLPVDPSGAAQSGSKPGPGERIEEDEDIHIIEDVEEVDPEVIDEPGLDPKQK